MSTCLATVNDTLVLERHVVFSLKCDEVIDNWLGWMIVILTWILDSYTNVETMMQ